MVFWNGSKSHATAKLAYLINQWPNPFSPIGNPLAFGVIYVIKHFRSFRYFISHDMKISLETQQHYPWLLLLWVVKQILHLSRWWVCISQWGWRGPEIWWRWDGRSIPKQMGQNLRTWSKRVKGNLTAWCILLWKNQLFNHCRTFDCWRWSFWTRWWGTRVSIQTPRSDYKHLARFTMTMYILGKIVVTGWKYIRKLSGLRFWIKQYTVFNVEKFDRQCHQIWPFLARCDDFVQLWASMS